jgi:putative hydrolase
MRHHFLGLVKSTRESVDPDPKRFMAGLQRFMEARRRGEDPMAEGGLMALFATDSQREIINQVSGLMSLLEGHGDVTMDRAGEGLVPSAERFGRVLRQRRQSAQGPAKLFQRFAGLDAKIKQYAQGERFIEIVEAAGGNQLLDRAWEGPENLPSIDEIRRPELWISRLAPELAA